MKEGSGRPLLSAILIGVVSLGVILGAFSLAAAEGGLRPGGSATAAAAQAGSPSPTSTATRTATATASATATKTMAGTATGSLTPTASMTPTGTLIYVPPVTAIPCTGAPAGWVIYVVRPGDTLYHIATVYGTSVSQLMTANCLTSTVIYVGQQLYVPNVPTITPSTVTPTLTPTPTSTGATSTSTPTDTATPTPSNTPLPTETPLPPSTDTPTPTPTP